MFSNRKVAIIVQLYINEMYSRAESVTHTHRQTDRHTHVYYIHVCVQTVAKCHTTHTRHLLLYLDTHSHTHDDNTNVQHAAYQ